MGTVDTCAPISTEQILTQNNGDILNPIDSCYHGV